MNHALTLLAVLHGLLSLVAFGCTGDGSARSAAPEPRPVRTGLAWWGSNVPDPALSTWIGAPEGVSRAGAAVDWTADGVALLGAPGGDGALLSATPTEPGSLVGEVVATGSGGGFGSAVAARTAGGSEVELWAVGAPESGEVHLVESDGARFVWAEGETTGTLSGTALAWRDGEGGAAPDLVVGAPRTSDQAEAAGAAWLIEATRVRDGGTWGAASARARGYGGRDARAGSDLTLTDLDQDGRADLVLATPGDSVQGFARAELDAGGDVYPSTRILVYSEEHTGRFVATWRGADAEVLLFSGEEADYAPFLVEMPLPQDAVVLGRGWEGPYGQVTFWAPGAYGLGFDPSALDLADTNADDRFDVVWGFADSSAVGVRLQAVDTTTGGSAWTFAGRWLLRSVTDDETGAAIAVGPDLDGDGRPELLVGAPAADEGRGGAWVVWSRAVGDRETPEW